MFKLNDKVIVTSNNQGFDGVRNCPGTIVGITKGIAYLSTSDTFLVGWKEYLPNTCKLHDKLRFHALAQYLPNILDWKCAKFVSVREMELVTQQNGYNCIICHIHYPYAQPNMPNNQLKCYSCRNT